MRLNVDRGHLFHLRQRDRTFLPPSQTAAPQGNILVRAALHGVALSPLAALSRSLVFTIRSKK
jgi:hypothetical protein